MNKSDEIQAAPVSEKTIDLQASRPASGSEGGHDAEKGGPPPEAQLQRRLKARHLQMIAIGMLIYILP